ncbi:MAG: carboxypeptidase-like regulatory domain-containing protein, partial [Bacteroidales bacterium]|nr:carboxypeptidase-like regulatory domain-containing protein [Bacteroidales bacterium]
MITLRKLILTAAALAAFLGMSLNAHAQVRTVRGRILDEADLPLPGAFVTVKGETRGSMTDNDGRFEISVKPTDVLVVSFLGYEDEEVSVGDRT